VITKNENIKTAALEAQAKIKGMKGPLLAYRFLKIMEIIRGREGKDIGITQSAEFIVTQFFGHMKPPFLAALWIKTMRKKYIIKPLTLSPPLKG
jgi:hypothetical protein